MSEKSTPADQPKSTEHLSNGGNSSNAAKAEQMRNRAMLLFCFFPLGVVSKQVLSSLSEYNPEAIYRLTRQGYVTSNYFELKEPDRKRRVYYYAITPEGVRYIKHYGAGFPFWLYSMPLPGLAFDKWGEINTNSMLAYIRMQDSILLFTLAGKRTLLTDLWASTRYSVMTILDIARMYKSPLKNSVVDCVFNGLMNAIKETNQSDMDFKRTCLRLYNGTETDQSLKPYMDFSENQIRFGCIKEIVHCYRSLGIETINPQSTRDSNVGIYSAEKQDYSVYLSTAYGLKYFQKSVSDGRIYNRICAARIYQSQKRPMEKQCTSGIVLCRNRTEFIRTIIDPYKIRSSENGYIGLYHDSLFLVPADNNGIRMISVLDSLDANAYKTAIQNEKQDIQVLFPEIQEISGQLIDTTNNMPCFDGLYFEVKTIYSAMEIAERNHCTPTLICEDWQAIYYLDLIKLWKRNPLTEEGKNGDYGLNVKTISLEEGENRSAEKWNSPYFIPHEKSELDERLNQKSGNLG